MKKLLIVLGLVFMLILSACGEEEKKSPSKKPDKNEQTVAISIDDAIEALTAKPQYAEDFPSVDKVSQQYSRANMAIGWIVGTQRVATIKEDTYEYDGLTYERVRPDCFYGIEVLAGGEDIGETQKLIYNMKTLELYLATLISPQDAKEYIIDIGESFEVPKFVENDNGVLYALPYSYTAAGYTDQEKYNLVDNGDGTYTFEVTYGVERSDGTVSEYTEQFGYENIDGRWLFTDFYVIKQN